MKYRPEIDGLRAIAVLGVILFHAGLAILPGGFLGVDVFFVISGYLITGILQADLTAGNFSLARFYERRIRRILPAPNMTMLLCIPVAMLVLLPDDLENFGQSLVATAAFANNILLMMTSGYFELENDFKPLMHTWSLGVEEHYYLLIPLLMWGAFAASGRRGLVRMTAIVVLASAVFCAWAARHAPNANFYLVLSRAWELGAGGLTLLMQPALAARLQPRAMVRDVLAFCGLLLLALSLLFFHNDMGLPDWPATLPIAGTVLLLLFADTSNKAGKLLSAPPLRFLGVLSYSAYLFHQPVFAFARAVSLFEPSQTLMLALTVPIFALAWLSWRFVEQPFRQARMIGLPLLIALVVGTSAVIVAAGFAMVMTSGFLQWRPELATGDPGFGRRQNATYNEEPFQYLGRPLPQSSAAPRVLVVGNSFARDFINMGLAAGRLRPDALSYAVPLCSLDLPTLTTARHADLIILATAVSPKQFSCLDKQLAQTSHISGARTYVLGTKNFGWNNNAVMLLPSERRYGWRAVPLSQIVAANQASARHYSNLYIDVMAKLSDREGRVPVFTPEHKFISQDRSHLTRAGAAYVGGLVFDDPRLRFLAPR